MRLAILSNAGGSGKTTLASHLAYLLAKKEKSVALIDLDPQGSVSLFCGLPRPETDQTIAAVLSDAFTGNWPLIPLWLESVNNVVACQGELTLVKTISELTHHPRGAYLLGDRLTDYPLSQKIVIFDCPATLGPLSTIAISAATHILIPIQVEPKSIDGSAKLLEWLYHTFGLLRLNPIPQILGVVPNQYDHRIAIHRNILEQINPMLKQLNIDCFEAIRYSSEFKNASAKGLPLHLYRPAHPAGKDFNPIIKCLISQLIKEATNEE
jgi:chromosome partitioning protein